MNNLKPAGKFYEETFHWSSQFSEVGINSKCILRLYANNGKFIGVGQHDRNSIGSVRRYATMLAATALEKCRTEYGWVLAEDFLWIEYYPKEANITWEDDYVLAHFDWNGNGFTNQRFKTISYEEVKEIIGVDPSKSPLRDKPSDFTETERKSFGASLAKALENQPVPDRQGGFLTADASEYILFEQNRDGNYTFGHPGAKSLVFLTPDGKILFTESQ